MTPDTLPCPCGKTTAKKPLAYINCCGRYLEDYEHTPAPDAESLMRSRYSAFVLQRADYLLATWEPAHRPATLDFEPKLKWLGLSVREAHQQDPDHATVEFIARSRLDGKATRLHERSRFERRNGRWLYIDGDIKD